EWFAFSLLLRRACLSGLHCHGLLDVPKALPLVWRWSEKKPMASELAEQVQKPPRSKQWHVPVFLAGMAALAIVWFARPLWHVTEEQKLDRQLAAARKALHQSPPDLKEALELAEAALGRCQQHPDRQGEAHLLVGSAYCRLAEQSPPSEADPIWRQARLNLEEAAKQTVSNADGFRLLYDLGKARSHT